MTFLMQWVQPWLATQNVNQNKGSLKAVRGAIERLSEPDWIDIVSPFFAFTMVIVLPMCVALWVIVKTIVMKDDVPDITSSRANGQPNSTDKPEG